MLAFLWHVWIGVLLTGVGFVMVLGLVALYLKKVVAPQFPGKHQRQD